jgi:hypothetical protein
MQHDRFVICLVVFLLVVILGAGLVSSGLRIDERTPIIATAIMLIAFTVRELLKAKGGPRDPGDKGRPIS